MNKIKQRLDELKKWKPESQSTQLLLTIIELQAEALEFCAMPLTSPDTATVEGLIETINTDIARAREALEQTVKLLGVE